MVDIMIPLGGGSRFDNFEIRYSLRSVEKHLKNVGNVYVIGQKPAFLQNVIHIPMEDEHRNKEINIYRKVLRACQLPGISKQFLFMNDDHFLNQDYDANNFPYFYNGELFALLKKKERKVRGYMQIVRKTANTLHSLGYPTKHFDIHTPILYDKAKFIEKMTLYDWTHSLGFIVKSLYANSLKIEGTKQKDYKINLKNVTLEYLSEIVATAPIWSIGSDIPEAHQALFDTFYPTPSRWERI